MSSLQAQNAVTASGVFQEGPERISVRVSGEFASEASLKAINLRINDRFFPLTDVATITPRLCRSANNLVSLQRSTRDRARDWDEIGRQSPEIWRGFKGGNVEDRCRLCRWEWGCISWRINQSSSNTRCRASRKRLFEAVLDRSWYQLSSAWDFEQGSLSRSRFHWFSQSRLS